MLFFLSACCREEDGGRRRRIAAVVSIIQDASPPLKSLLYFKEAVRHVKDKARQSSCESFNIYQNASSQMRADERINMEKKRSFH